MALDGILDLIAGQLTGLPGTQLSIAVRGTGILAPYAYLVYACSCPINPDLDQRDIASLEAVDARRLSEITSEAQDILDKKDEYYIKKCTCEEKSK